MKRAGKQPRESQGKNIAIEPEVYDKFTAHIGQRGVSAKFAASRILEFFLAQEDSVKQVMRRDHGGDVRPMLAKMLRDLARNLMLEASDDNGGENVSHGSLTQIVKNAGSTESAPQKRNSKSA